jgi:hypothetical protein
MRNLPFIIVAGLLVLLMLAVGLWSRNYAIGPKRSIQFGNDIRITTQLTDPVAVIVSVQNPDGTITPLAWASLGTIEGTTMQGGAVTFPTSGTLLVQFASGMSIVQGGVPVNAISGANAVTGGPASPGVAMVPIAGLPVRLNGTTNVFITPGSMTTIEINDYGAAVNLRPAVPAPPPVPPAPSPAAGG